MPVPRCVLLLLLMMMVVVSDTKCLCCLLFSSLDSRAVGLWLYFPYDLFSALLLSCRRCPLRVIHVTETDTQAGHLILATMTPGRPEWERLFLMTFCRMAPKRSEETEATAFAGAGAGVGTTTAGVGGAAVG